MLGEVGGTSGTPLLPRTTKRKSRLSKQVVPEPEEVNDQAEETQDSTLNEADANETERMILSHLENSSSFDFLPTQVDLDPNLDPALGENPTQEATEVENEGVDDPMAVSAVSRIKKGPPGSCDICGRTETSVWRKLSLGGNDMKVCNGRSTFICYCCMAKKGFLSLRSVSRQIRYHKTTSTLGRRQVAEEAARHPSQFQRECRGWRGTWTSKES